MYIYLSEVKLGLLDLPAEEARHLTKAARLGVGAKFFVTNGLGAVGTAVIKSITKVDVKAEVVDVKQLDRPAPLLHLGIAPTKNADRIEWLAEKGTEMGLAKLSLVNTDRTERSKINLDRLERICKAAAKQCKTGYMPEIQTVDSFKEWVSLVSSIENKAIAWLGDKTISVHTFFHNVSVIDERAVAVGPEGDFTEDEVQEASKCGFKAINLGVSTLRTETAGLFITALNYNSGIE